MMTLEKSAWTVLPTHNPDDASGMLTRLANACRDDETSPALYRAAVRNILKASAEKFQAGEYQQLTAQALADSKKLGFDTQASRIAFGLQETNSGLAKSITQFAIQKNEYDSQTTQRSSALLSLVERKAPKILQNVLTVTIYKLTNHKRSDEIKSDVNASSAAHAAIQSYVDREGLHSARWDRLTSVQQLGHIRQMFQAYADRIGFAGPVKMLQAYIGEADAAYHTNGRFSFSEQFLKHAALCEVLQKVAHEADHLREDVRSKQGRGLQGSMAFASNLHCKRVTYKSQTIEVAARLAEKLAAKPAALVEQKGLRGLFARARAALIPT